MVFWEIFGINIPKSKKIPCASTTKWNWVKLQTLIVFLFHFVNSLVFLCEWECVTFTVTVFQYTYVPPSQVLQATNVSWSTGCHCTQYYVIAPSPTIQSEVCEEGEVMLMQELEWIKQKIFLREMYFCVRPVLFTAHVFVLLMKITNMFCCNILVLLVSSSLFQEKIKSS